MKTLRYALADEIYGDFSIVERALSRHFRIVLDDDDPEVVFCGDSYKLGGYARFANALRINLQHENRTPNWGRYHYILGFRHSRHPRQFRLPLYVRTVKAEDLIRRPGEVETVLPDKTRFCATVVSNAGKFRTWRRDVIADALDKRKTVDFGGRYRNNVGGPVADKLAFYGPYRFVICAENHSWPGHTTEKIADAMKMRCIPIYWGNPRIAEDFNPASFVNAHDFRTTAQLVDRVLEIDATPSLYRQIFDAPYFRDNVPSRYFDPAPLGDFLARAIESPRPRLARVTVDYSVCEMYRRASPYVEYAAARLKGDWA